MLDTSEPIRAYRINISSKIDPFYVRPFPVWKRILDIVGAIAGLVLFSPLLAVIAVYIRIVSPGPIIFRQMRIGTGGAQFAFYKFRTMRLDVDTAAHREYLAELIKGGEGDEADRPMVKREDCDRIIPFGQLLRKSCLDELPQLVNVLKGEMSLVGPRPPIPYEVAEYYRWHNGRFDGRPGLTGLWQVSGKNSLSFKEMVRLDIDYTRKCSLWLDLFILLKTPYTMYLQVKHGMGCEKPDAEG